MIRYQCKSFEELSVTELYEILKIRQEVFIVEQDCVYLDNDDKDQDAWHLLGSDEKGSIQSYARLLPKGISYPGHASIGRVLTTSAVRGTGEGKQLMQKSIELTQSLYPGQPIKISAQCYAIRFYESVGFKAIGEEYLEDDIPHIAMILD